MILVPAYGAVELYIRREISKGINSIPRGTTARLPDEPNRPLAGQPRQLTSNQMRVLVTEAAKLKNTVPMIVISISPGDNEAWRYRKQFHDTLLRAGILVKDAEQNPAGPDQQDVMIVMRDAVISPAEQQLREVLEIIDIQPKIIPMPDNLKNMPRDIGPLLFIGPVPLL